MLESGEEVARELHERLLGWGTRRRFKLAAGERKRERDEILAMLRRVERLVQQLIIVIDARDKEVQRDE